MATKKTTKKTATKTPAPKTATRKSAPKKTAATKKTAKKKAATKKAVGAPLRGRPKAATKKAATKKAATKKTATKKTTKKKTTKKKTTAKPTTKKKATKKKPTAKKTTAKKTAATKTAAQKTATKKTATRKTARKKTAAPTTSTPLAAARKSRVLDDDDNQFAEQHSVSPAAYAWHAHRKSDVANVIDGAYRGGDGLAHPVTAEQMAEVSHDGLRDHETIDHVEDDGDVAPCRLVDHGEGNFSLCLDDFRMPNLPAFHTAGLAGNGYTWEALADSVARLRRPELVHGLSYDSEAGMFVATGSRPTLVALARLIQELIDDDTLLQQAIAAADPDSLE